MEQARDTDQRVIDGWGTGPSVGHHRDARLGIGADCAVGLLCRGLDHDLFCVEDPSMSGHLGG